MVPQEEQRTPGTSLLELNSSLDTSINCSRDNTSQHDSPTRDSVMSDETAPQSAIEVQMLLDDDEETLKVSMSPNPTSQSASLAGIQGQEERVSGREPPGASTPHPIERLSTFSKETLYTPSTDKLSSTLTPQALASTPRHSPRLSPAPASITILSPKQSYLRNKMDDVPPTLSPQPASTRKTAITSATQHTPMGDFVNRTPNSFSLDLPLPSIFQPEPSWAAPTMPPRNSEGRDNEMREATPQAEERHQKTSQVIQQSIKSESAENLTTNTGLGEREGSDGVDSLMREVHMEHTGDEDMNTSLSSPDSSGSPDKSFVLPTAAGIASADLSSNFASLTPNLPQPFLSPVQIQSTQTFQSFSLQSTSVQGNAQSTMTPPRPVSNGDPPNRLSSLSPTQTTLLDCLVNPFASSIASPIPTPFAPKKATAFVRSGANSQQQVPSSQGPLNPASEVVGVKPSTGTQPPVTPTKTFEGSLVPVTTPSNLHPPFPVSPQREIVRSHSAPGAVSSSTKEQPSARPVTPTSNFHPPITSSKIPVPLSSATSNHGPTAGRSINKSFSLGLSPSSSSQLRQPSTLRTMLNGAASKIPRPGKKPYSKPPSRLPKPQVKVSVPAFPSNPPKTVQPPPAQVSPIKTRRGRAAQNALKSAPAPVITELPPDAIIRQPPPPRIKPKSEHPITSISKDADTALDPDQEKAMVSGRASPPVETGMSPPKSGLLLKNQTRRLKEGAVAPKAHSSLESVIPEFSASAPSLNIFPALTRPKGKGRSTVQRPMLMPLDASSLRQITTSNTLRNQEYVCSKVETKVVLKEGKRPASPTTKVKTVLEKQKEQKERGRELRAAARRNGRFGSQSKEQTPEPESRKHPRGAGEDEDYETPVKYRQRDEMDVDGLSEQKKRVKWDKDLLQRFEPEEMNIDEIKNRAGAARTKVAAKSCISTQVILDSLGNVPEAHVPVANLKKEEVVVTRLVYIDELPPSERPKRAAATKANARITPIS